MGVSPLYIITKPTMAKASFDAMSVTNILDTEFVMEYTDPTSPLDKVEVRLEAGETKQFAVLMGGIIASDIASTYCVTKGHRHYGADLQLALQLVKGESKLVAPAPAKAKATAPVAPAPTPDEDPEDLDPEEEGEGEEEAPEATAPEATAPAKTKVKR